MYAGCMVAFCPFGIQGNMYDFMHTTPVRCSSELLFLILHQLAAILHRYAGADTQIRAELLLFKKRSGSFSVFRNVNYS